jgi:hypothetical protein
LCNEYLNWASIGLIKLCWPQEVQDRVRGQIAEVLALDPQVMEIAAQIELSATQRVPTRLAHYNHVQADKLRYLTLAFEAPQFIALYFLLGDKLSSQQEVTYSMKQYLREFGFGAAVWRLLSREGTHWIIEYLAYFDIQRQSLGSCAIEILKMACAFGTHALPPSELLHALIQLGGNPNQPSAYFVTRVDDQFALCRRLGILAQRADASTLQLLKEQAMTIFEWGSDHAQFVPDATLRRISLKGLLRKAEIQALRDKKKRESGPSWKSPFEIDLQDSNVSAVILTSTLAIWQEGQVMHHCADKFGRRCAGGELLMVSLRDARHRHPLATASFSMNKPMVQIHKYSGFANGRISSQTYDLIEQCRQQLQMQRHVQAVELEDFELPA